VVGVGAAVGVGRWTGIAVPVDRALLAIPVAVGLALVAAAVPVARAARAHPGGAVATPVAAPGRWAGRRRSLAGLAAANLVRMPGRSLLGVVALAVGTAGLTMVVAVRWAFEGTAVGTVLGDVVSVRIRPVDTVSAAATVLLGLFAVTDVLYLNVRDRAAELATLRATGWSEFAVGRLIAYEGLGIGLLGALLGAGIGLASAAWFAGAVPPALFGAAGVVAATGAALAALASVIPALLQRRVRISILLAGES
jgi:putative ABC transport system permease protein